MASEVLVALVVVLLTAVKLPKVDDALVRMPPVRVERPETVKVPLCVVLPEVSVPKDAAVANRLVELAVVAKKLVEVALPKRSLLVALNAPATVVEPVTARAEVVAPPVTLRLKMDARFDTENDVEVALVVVPNPTLKLVMLEEALMMMPSVVVGVSAPLTNVQSWKLVVCATVA